MRNAVGREIPEEILKATGKDVFKGSFAMHQVAYTEDSPAAGTGRCISVCMPETGRRGSGGCCGRV